MSNRKILPMNGQKVSGRELRTRLNAESNLLIDQAIPAIQRLQHNDGVTQKHVTDLEQRCAVLEQQSGTLSLEVMAPTFWARLCWLVRGPRFNATPVPMVKPETFMDVKQPQEIA